MNLYDFGEVTMKEIGETLGLPVSTIKIRIFRAKKTLLDKWRELGGEGDLQIRGEG